MKRKKKSRPLDRAARAAPPSSQRAKYFGVCLALALSVLVIYGQTTRFSFVNLDDDHYIYANPRILQGLTAGNVVAAFTESHANLWHPLATLTHLLDVQLYGKWAGGHHLTGVVVHLGAVLLLLFALDRLTGNFARSAFAAGLFGLHPLRTESVAWVCERKDVLSGLCFALLLWVYARYVERPTRGRYLWMVFVFALGSMSKPMFVTVPFVLLLLDYWPLRRAASADPAMQWTWKRLLLEKIPLVLIAAGVVAVTIYVQRPAIQSLENFTLGARLANAACSYVIYLRQFFWPVALAVFYPHRFEGIPLAEVVASSALLLVLTATAVALRRKLPYLFVGWFWYLGMLVPVIGLMQAGLQAHADRFTYLPQIGIAVIIAWGTADFVTARRVGAAKSCVAAVLVLTILVILSWRQTTHWANGVTLFAHALERVGPSDIVHNNFGVALAQQGRLEESLAQYREAMRLNHKYVAAVANYGDALRQLDRLEEAVVVLRQALPLDPENLDVGNNLGESLLRLGRLEEAIAVLEDVKRRDPNFASARNNLGLARVQQGRLEEAVAEYRQALAVDSNLGPAHSNLARALYRQGRPSEAIFEFRESLRLIPNNAETLKSAAWVAATAAPPDAELANDAVTWAAKAVELTGRNDPITLDVLAASLASAHRYPEAVKVAERAMAMAAAQNRNDLVELIRVHAVRYQAGMLWLEPPPNR